MACFGVTVVVFYYSVVIRLLYNYACNATFSQLCVHVVLIGNAVFLVYHLDFYAMEVGVCAYHIKYFRIDG